MEEDDIEMSEVELQEWIKEEVKKSQLVSSDVLEKCNILQSHLERREKRAARLLKLCESVAACEAIIRKQYSLLGWEYTDTLSEGEGDKVTNCGSSPQTVCGSVQSDTQDKHSSATSKLRYSWRLNDNYREICSNVLKRKPVVVLTRLPAFKSRSLYPCNAMKTRTSRENPTSDAKDSTKTSPPAANTNGNVKSGTKTLMPGATRNAMCDVDASTPQTEIIVDTLVLARRGEMTWQRGQIKEIHTKEDGRLKYKVFFENKVKRLVSGHHIAIDHVAAVDNLSVGTRVVIKRPDDQVFCPGILAEQPNRKNRMRFLVFTDDQEPYYVSLPLLYLVYKPLPDPLDDIMNEDHRTFLKEYLKNWPCTPQTNYRIGQMIHVELNGSLQKCEVQVVDSSIMQVLFQKTKQKEWLYRGSSRLEHTINRKRELTKN